MDEPKQLTEAAQLVGKTIARVSGLGEHGPDALVFTDGSFAMLGQDDDGVFVSDEPALGYDLLALELITQDECQRRALAARNARIAADEARARAEYERLKARFEPQPTEAS